MIPDLEIWKPLLLTAGDFAVVDRTRKGPDPARVAVGEHRGVVRQFPALLPPHLDGALEREDDGLRG